MGTYAIVEITILNVLCRLNHFIQCNGINNSINIAYINFKAQQALINYNINVKFNSIA